MIGERLLGFKVTRRHAISFLGTVGVGIGLGAWLVNRESEESPKKIEKPKRVDFLHPEDRPYMSKEQYFTQFDAVFEAAHNGLTHEYTRIPDDRFLEGTCEFETQDGKLITLERGQYITGETFRYVTISTPQLLSKPNVPGQINRETIVYLKFEGRSRTNPILQTVERKWEYQNSMTRKESLIHVEPKTLYAYARDFTKNYNWAVENGEVRVLPDEQSPRQQRSRPDHIANETAA